MDETEKLKKELEETKKELAAYKLNGAVGLYYELNRLINDTISITRETNLKTLLSSDDKGDKRFERMMVLIKNAKEHLLDLQDIKDKLGLSGDEDSDKQRKPFIETIADKRQ